MGMLTLHLCDQKIFKPVKENKFQYVLYHKFFAAPLPGNADGEALWERQVFYRMADIWRAHLAPNVAACPSCGTGPACAARHTYAGPCGGGAIVFRSHVGTAKDLSVVLTARGEEYTETALVEIANRLVEVLAAACDGKLSAASLAAESASSESRKAKCVVAVDEMFFGAHLDTTDVETILKASKLKV